MPRGSAAPPPAIFFAPLPAVLMVCVFPDKVFWWNYILLVPALLQTFVFLPLWHRQRYGLDVMRTKLVYAWAHVFAFRDRLTGRKLPWNPTGRPSPVMAASPLDDAGVER